MQLWEIESAVLDDFSTALIAGYSIFEQLAGRISEYSYKSSFSKLSALKLGAIMTEAPKALIQDWQAFNQGSVDVIKERKKFPLRQIPDYKRAAELYRYFNCSPKLQ